MQHGMEIKANSATLCRGDEGEGLYNNLFYNLKPRRTLTKVQTLYTRVSLKGEGYLLDAAKVKPIRFYVSNIKHKTFKSAIIPARKISISI